MYAAPSKKTNTGGGTLGRRTRRGHASALSSSSTASDRSETVFPDEHSRMHLTNGKPTRVCHRFFPACHSPPAPIFHAYPAPTVGFIGLFVSFRIACSSLSHPTPATVSNFPVILPRNYPTKQRARRNGRVSRCTAGDPLYPG